MFEESALRRDESLQEGDLAMVFGLHSDHAVSDAHSTCHPLTIPPGRSTLDITEPRFSPRRARFSCLRACFLRP